MHYKPDVILHSVTLDMKMRDDLNRGCATNWRCMYHRENTVTDMDGESHFGKAHASIVKSGLIGDAF